MLILSFPGAQNALTLNSISVFKNLQKCPIFYLVITFFWHIDIFLIFFSILKHCGHFRILKAWLPTLSVKVQVRILRLFSWLHLYMAWRVSLWGKYSMRLIIVVTGLEAASSSPPFPCWLLEVPLPCCINRPILHRPSKIHLGTEKKKMTGKCSKKC